MQNKSEGGGDLNRERNGDLDRGGRISKRTLASAALILLLIPVTLMLGVFVLDDRKYYFISLLLILYSMVPFFLVFEHRKPQARELIVISVLTAIAVAGRLAFFMVPQFKPVIAVVIIAGICFGAESGFFVGAMTGFVSNFFFGQGPWTPWQMFCFGIIGFLAGLLFQKGLLPKKRSALCVYGGLATFFIYGGLINISSLLMSTPVITKEAVIAVYGAAVWFDLIHAAATVIFLFFLAKPFMEKLDRIKIKYGMMENPISLR